MLNNLKVGTKLFAILAAPVIVLLILTVIGVNERRTISSSAARVGELTLVAEADAALMFDVQREGVYSAQYMASDKQVGRAELDAQRAKTDQALANFKKAVDTYRPGELSQEASELLRKEANESVANAVGRTDDLETNRNSVNDLQNGAKQTIDQYVALTEALFDVNVAISKSVVDPRLSRSFDLFVTRQRAAFDAGHEAMLLTAIAQIGFVPSRVTATLPVKLMVACQDVRDKDECNILFKIEDLKDSRDVSDAAANDESSVEQKQTFRDRFADNQFETPETKFFNQVTSSRNPASESDSTASSLPGFKEASDKLLVTNGSIWLINAYQMVLLDPADSLVVDLKAAANSVQSEADNSARLYAIGALGSVALAFIVAIAVYRATTVPLKKLTSAAYLLSTERLPGLVERLRNPEEADGMSLAESLTPIDINSKDEIGQLADAFNSIQQVTIEVAEEQAQLLRKGIGDIFINLARRNQTLLDRQIEFIDQLEANEEDPDQLDNLFKLDHLATRMRRNAESLLVLAGAEPPRRRGRPVALADVVRVAIGEVEDFARIQLLALDDATVGGNVAVDLAHLLSELMENATHFSPPDTMVEVVGHRADDGSYIISVSDQGIGMSADQLSEANTQLANPPLVGLALSRSLGFIVIGRLAQRFNIHVKLTASPSGGVTALVTLPDDLVTYEGEAPAASAPAQAMAKPAVAEQSWAPAPEPEIVLDDEVLVLDDVRTPELDSGSDTGADLLDGPDLFEELTDDDGIVDSGTDVSEGADFDEGLRSLVDEQLPDGPIESATIGEPPTEPAVVAKVAEPAPVAINSTGKTVAEQIAAASRAEAKVAELTASGLVKRTPKKRSATTNEDGSPIVASKSAGQSTRSPEEVRKMLSRYRAGASRGKGEVEGEKNEK